MHRMWRIPVLQSPGIHGIIILKYTESPATTPWTSTTWPHWSTTGPCKKWLPSYATAGAVLLCKMCWWQIWAVTKNTRPLLSSVGLLDFPVGFLLQPPIRWTWESSPNRVKKNWSNYCLKDSTFKIFCNSFLILIRGMIKTNNMLKTNKISATNCSSDLLTISTSSYILPSNSPSNFQFSSKRCRWHCELKLPRIGYNDTLILRQISSS